MNIKFDKEINSEKLKLYFDVNPDITKKDIADSIHRSRTFLNDIIRRGNCNILIMDTICDKLGLPHDYFDKEEEKVIEEATKPIENYEEHFLHDDLMKLFISNRKIESLLQELVQLWSEPK